MWEKNQPSDVEKILNKKLLNFLSACDYHNNNGIRKDCTLKNAGK